MISEPLPEHYSSYGAFALSALGYALLVEGCSDSTRNAVGFGVNARDCFVRTLGDERAGQGRIGTGSSSGNVLGGERSTARESISCVRCGVRSNFGGVGDDVVDSTENGGRDKRANTVVDGLSNEGNVQGFAEVAKADGCTANVKGRWYEHNKRKRNAAKEKKKINSSFKDVNLKSSESNNWREKNKPIKDAVQQDAPNVKSDLRFSLEAKWAAENKFAALKAERAYNALLSVPVDEYNKREQLRVRANNEKTMVSIEKTHATLRATGNVPGVVGSVETILDTTISPNSSASMQEFRKVQKQCLDLQEKIERMEKKFGVDSNDLDFLEKNTYTDTSENHEKLLKYIPGDFGIIPVGEGDNGKNYFKVEILGGDVY